MRTRVCAGREGRSKTHEDYVTVASEVSGQDQSGFLKDWLYGTKTPRMPGHSDRTVTPVNPSLTTPHRRTGGRYHDASATL